MGKFVKKHKVLCIVLTIVLIVSILIGCLLNAVFKNAQKMMDKLMQSETAEVERRDLVTSIPVNGTIVSIRTKDVKTEMSGVKVTEVFVNVGDSVEEGQLLCTLDATSAEENLSIAQKNQQVSNQSTTIGLNSAQRQLIDAKEAQAFGIQQGLDQLSELEKSKNSAEEELKKYTDSYNNAVNKRKNIENNINNAKNRIKAIDERLVAIAKELEELALLPTPEPTQLPSPSEAPAPSTNPEPLSTQAPIEDGDLTEHAMDNEDPIALRRQELENEATTITTEKATLTSSILQWETELAVAKQEEQASYELYIAKVKTVEAAKSSYDSAVKTNEHTAKSYASQVESAKDNLTNMQGNASVSNLTNQQQIQSLKDQIDNCNVYAPFSGVITALNVEKGDTYMGTPIVTVEDVEGFEIQAYISEYEVGKIKEGMEVAIKTNGTGEQIIKGTIRKIDPRATKNAMSSEVSYGVRVSIDEKVEGIRLDMTAKLSIILEKVENVITVPYDAVQTETDDETQKYVEVETGEKDESGKPKTKKIYITTGIESDYYVEILSGDITEGMKVVIPRDEFTALDLNALLEEEGALGGY